MTLITFFSICVAFSTAFTLPPQSTDSPIAKFNQRLEKADQFYKTLPKEVQEDAKLLVPELIRKNGYPCEKHVLRTPDGYILEIHRIPYGRGGSSSNRPVVLLKHGLQSSSADWLIPGPGKALPYILADAGYDVWLSNARGNRYSRNHIHLDPDKDGEHFFSFSWHEIAVIDLPTVIDYVLAESRQERIFYIGHSQGTTVSYILLSEMPEYNDKFKAIVHFAPTAYLTHAKSPLVQLSPLVNLFEKYCQLVGIYEISATDEARAEMGELMCNDDSIFQVLCTNMLFISYGYNPDQLNATLLPIIMGHTPAGASIKQTIHYGQVSNSGIFRQWDYGRQGNQENYGSDNPPKYQLQNIKVPLHLFYSTNDWLGNVTDVMHLYSQLSTAQLHLVPDSKFNHVDYLYAINAPEVVYEKVLRLLSEYL